MDRAAGGARAGGALRVRLRARGGRVLRRIGKDAFARLDEVPGHDICADFAEAPQGTLVLHGELHAALYPIQWALGRHWFVERLEPVADVGWRDVVADNLLAQDPGLWQCPHLLTATPAISCRELRS